MPKLDWNKFTNLYPNAPAYTTAVSSSLPKGMILDKNGLKLPTPYALLVKWLNYNIPGDWTSMTKSGFVIVKVAAPEDELVIVTKFPKIGISQKSPASVRTIQISYSDSDYVNLASTLGYKLK